ncbi:unnamed protein product, partial [Phaeothamnion confervicola]
MKLFSPPAALEGVKLSEKLLVWLRQVCLLHFLSSSVILACFRIWRTLRWPTCCAMPDSTRFPSNVPLSRRPQILHDNGLSVEDIFSGTSDAGSDVKRLFNVSSRSSRWLSLPTFLFLAVLPLVIYYVLSSAALLQVLLESFWGWCLPYMCNVALKEAFGGNLTAQGCKNQRARGLWKIAKAMIEHLNKSPLMKTKFYDLQVEEFGSVLKLVNDAPQRWSSA